MFNSDIFLNTLKNVSTVWVGYSGGIDSHVLLHSLTFYSLSLRAIHINHGLSPFANEWEVHCQSVCDHLKIPLHIIRVNAKPFANESPEAAARRARYHAFSSLIQKDDYLLTAQHQDDQAETILLQMFRGAGPKGLSAMPILTPFSAGFLYRPFLNITRQTIEEYAKVHQLKWIEDESNNNRNFDRNFLRHQVIPLIKQRWPSVNATLKRSASHCAEMNFLLEEMVSFELTSFQGRFLGTLSKEKLLNLSEEKQRQLLRIWLQQKNFQLPSLAKLMQIQKTVLASSHDAQPEVRWQNIIVRRYVDDIFADKIKLSHDATVLLPWDFSELVTLPNNLGYLSASQMQGQGIRCASIHDKSQISIRFRQGGERFRPDGRIGSHPLKKLFQEWHVPPWERDRVPLIYLKNDLIAVAGHSVHHDYSAKQDELGWVITVQ